MEWHQAVRVIAPHIVGISTPTLRGTGFLVSHSTITPIVGIATAHHVAAHAHEWEHPIRITHHDSKQSILLRHGERAIFLDEANDTAGVVFQKGELAPPDQPPLLIAEKRSVKVGGEIGWLGFPAVSPSELCFFSGRVSAYSSDSGHQRTLAVSGRVVEGGRALSTVIKKCSAMLSEAT